MTTTDPATTNSDTTDRQPFSAFVADHRYGQLNPDLTEALGDLIEAVHSLGKTGELKLTIKIAPHGQGQLLVKDSLALKLPEPPQPEFFYWAAEGGGLSRRDPRQPQLPDID